VRLQLKLQVIVAMLVMRRRRLSAGIAKVLVFGVVLGVGCAAGAILSLGVRQVSKDKTLLEELMDKRTVAAIYGTNASKRDRQAIELFRAFCLVNNLRGVLFLDKRIDNSEHPPAWDRLCDELSKGKFQIVMTWLDLDVPAMERWCVQYGVKFEHIDIFEWYSAVGPSSKADMGLQ